MKERKKVATTSNQRNHIDSTRGRASNSKHGRDTSIESKENQCANSCKFKIIYAQYLTQFRNDSATKRPGPDRNSANYAIDWPKTARRRTELELTATSNTKDRSQLAANWNAIRQWAFIPHIVLCLQLKNFRHLLASTTQTERATCDPACRTVQSYACASPRLYGADKRADPIVDKMHSQKAISKFICRSAQGNARPCALRTKQECVHLNLQSDSRQLHPSKIRIPSIRWSVALSSWKMLSKDGSTTGSAIIIRTIRTGAQKTLQRFAFRALY